MIKTLNNLKINSLVINNTKKSSFMFNRLCFYNIHTNFSYINNNYITRLNLTKFV